MRASSSPPASSATGVPVRGRPSSPLLRWRLVERHAGSVRCDPQVVAWLLGRTDLDAALVGHAAPLPARHRSTPGRWRTSLTPRRGRSRRVAALVRIVVRGATGYGRRTFAATVAARSASRRSNPDRSRRALAADSCCARRDRRCSTASRPSGPATGPSRCPGTPARTRSRCSSSSAIPDGGHRPARAFDLVVDLPAPRQPTAAGCGSSSPRGRGWGAAELDRLAPQFRASPARSPPPRRPPATAPAAAGLCGGRPPTARAASRSDSSARSSPMTSPSPTGCATCSTRSCTRRRRAPSSGSSRPRALFPTGRALVALFAGPPGTGKTMAAQVIAGRLGFDLWRVDLSTLISKYVGETAENVERLLKRASGATSSCSSTRRTRSTESARARSAMRRTATSTWTRATSWWRSRTTTVSSCSRRTRKARSIRRSSGGCALSSTSRSRTRPSGWRSGTGSSGLAGQAARPRARHVLDRSAEVAATGSQIKYAVLGGIFAARRPAAPLPPTPARRAQARARQGRTAALRS